MMVMLRDFPRHPLTGRIDSQPGGCRCRYGLILVVFLEQGVGASGHYLPLSHVSCCFGGSDFFKPTVKD